MVDVRVERTNFLQWPVSALVLYTTEARIPIRTVSWGDWMGSLAIVPVPLPTSKQAVVLNAVRTSVGLPQVDVGKQDVDAGLRGFLGLEKAE